MSHKLLLADDSITIQRVIELTFAGEDIQVVVVSDGEQAIQRIPFEKPDIVLADIGTPKRSGYEIAAFVKQHPQWSHVPVLLLAGAFEPVDEARARQVRSDGILVKPFEPRQVVARVRELVDAGRARASSSESRGPSLESRLPAPEPASTSLDDYFDRLDAAFTTPGSPRTQPPASAAAPLRDDRPAGTKIPTIEDLLSGASLRSQAEVPALGRVAPPPAEPPDASPTLVSSPRPNVMPSPGRGNALAQSFSLLLAVEQGELDAEATGIGPVSPQIEITDELMDRITRHVLQRLTPDTARKLVAQIVSEVADRLVREEIDRIRKA